MIYFTQNRTKIALAACLFTVAACSSNEQIPRSSPTSADLDVALPEVVLAHSREASTLALLNADAVQAKSMHRPLVLVQQERISPAEETYAHYPINDTKQTINQRVSTFSIDVDTGAYSNMRRFIQDGTLPPEDAIRIEELLNYFDYQYKSGSSIDEPFSIDTEIASSPWNGNTHLLRIGLAGYSPNARREPSSNLVFLLDVSGSMKSADKLGLVKSSISMMTEQLDQNDSISIVVYAGSSGTVLEPTPGDQKARINRALGQLSAGGSTNGQQGIELAYQLASENYIEDGVNRVILATDGDFNVGTTDIESLKKLIARKRDSGIALTTLGFGSGNYNDHLMEQLAQEGNGNYAYIDTLGEARKVLVDELDASLINIAKDVKIQVEFNPQTVTEYRLIGYTNRKLNNEDFDNDKVDAGEIGAGHTVTAIYEIALAGNGGEKHTATRYQPELASIQKAKTGELADIRLRYKLPNKEHSQLFNKIVTENDIQPNFNSTSDDYRFAVSVAAFGQHLQKNKNMQALSLADIHKLAANAKNTDTFGYRAEFLKLVQMADTLDKIERAALSPMDKPNERG